MRKCWVCMLALLFALAIALPAFAIYGEAPVVSDPADQVNPAISGQTVVWQDYRHRPFGCPNAQNCVSADIYARDLGTGVEQRLSTASNAMDPDIDGNTVVWRDWSTGKIVVHTLSTGSQQNASTLGGTVQMVTPAVSGQTVVWIDYRNSNEYGDIYMRDLTQPADVPLNVAPSNPSIPVTKKDKRNPDIDGNIVVWEDWTNAYQDTWGWWHNPDIYMKDLSTGVIQPVCTNTADQYSPTVSGDKVFWQDYRYSNWDIYMKDLSTGIESRVTISIADQSWPAVDGDLLAWKDTRNGNEDIYAKRLSLGVEEQVSSDPSSQKIPVISGTTIAWIDKRNGNWDVYKGEVDTVAPQVDTVAPSGWLTSDTTTISATYSDVGEGVDAASVAIKVDGGLLTGCSVTASQMDCPVTGVPDGSYTITVDLNDLAGNAATTGTAVFSVDTSGPSIGPLVIDSLPDSDTATITAALSDPDPGSGLDTASVYVNINGASIPGCSVGASQVSCVVSGLAIGVQQVEAGAADVVGNSSTLSDSFEILDTVAPDISNPAPSGPLTAAWTDIVADFSDPYPGSGVDENTAVVELDGVPLSGCSATAGGVSCHVTSLVDGVHQVSASVDDASGNTGTLNWSFSVNAGGPVIDNLSPANGATVNNPWTAVSADITDNGRGVDSASIRVYLDGVDITSSTGYSNGTVQHQLTHGTDPGFANQPHTARVVAADLDGETAEQVWSFDITSPELKLSHLKTYWPSYAAYTQGLLMVDYRMANPGTGACRAAEVATGSASSGVVIIGPLPVDLGDIAAGAHADYNFSYMVPGGVKSFLAVSNANCMDDGGNIYRFAGPPPA